MRTNKKDDTILNELITGATISNEIRFITKHEDLAENLNESCHKRYNFDLSSFQLGEINKKTPLV